MHHPLAPPRIVRILQNFWAQHPTDLVLSVIPHFNACLAESIQKEISGAPFVTVLTDLADYPPNFWIERNSDISFAVPKGRGNKPFRWGIRRTGLSRLLHGPEAIVLSKPRIDRDEERIKLGCRRTAHRNRHVRGHGSSSMLEIARKLEKSPCERN